MWRGYAASTNPKPLLAAAENTDSTDPASKHQKALLTLAIGIVVVLGLIIGLKVNAFIAMITGSAMLAGVAQPETLGFHPAYLACAIGSGSLVGSWMNDSGFWIFAKTDGIFKQKQTIEQSSASHDKR